MNKNEIKVKIFNIISKEFEVEKNKLDLSIRLEDLDLDSLDIIDFNYAVEKEFDIKLDKEIKLYQTIGNIVSILFVYLEDKKGDNKMTTEKIIIYNDTMKRLDNDVTSGKFDYLHQKNIGIRSTQVGALVALLVEKGIIK